MRRGIPRRFWWDENPGKKGGDWKEHVIDSGKNVEFAELVDLENTGKARDVLPQYGGANDGVVWFEPKNGGFVKHVVSEQGFGPRNQAGRCQLRRQKTT